MEANARQAADLKKLKKIKKIVLSCSVNATKRPTGVRKKRKTRGEGATLSHFWRHSLGVSLGLAKTMFARDRSKDLGSEARGEGKERGYFE